MGCVGLIRFYLLPFTNSTKFYQFPANVDVRPHNSKVCRRRGGFITHPFWYGYVRATVKIHKNFFSTKIILFNSPKTLDVFDSYCPWVWLRFSKLFSKIHIESIFNIHFHFHFIWYLLLDWYLKTKQKSEEDNSKFLHVQLQN